MNADWAPGGSQPSSSLLESSKESGRFVMFVMGGESAENWQLPSTSTVAIVIIT